jgi:hypothetical protein
MPLWVQVVGALAGFAIFSITMAVFHASLVGAFEGQPLMIVTAAALIIALVASAYLTDRKNRP